MLFLVISKPTPSKPSDVKKNRQEFKSWMKELENKKKVVSFYPRVARGSVVIFDVESNNELHFLLSKWLEIVPVKFDIYPLVSTKNYL